MRSHQMEDLTDAKDGGILKEILCEGNGIEKPCAGDKVFVHYIGKLVDGTIFDSNIDDEKFAFILGRDLIQGFDICVSSMTKGEKCKLVVKPEYAYGTTGFTPKIPPNTPLIYEIELLDWQKEHLSEDCIIIKSQLTKGTGYNSPKEGAIVEVHLLAKYNGNILYERDITFELGKGCDIGVAPSIELALERFKKGEKSLLKVTSNECAGDNVAPGTEIEYQVHLKEFEKDKNIWEYGTSEKIVQANFCKTKGNQHFKNGQFASAANEYRMIMTYLENEKQHKTDTQNRINELLLSGLSNLVMCLLKEGEYAEAAKHCDTVLQMETNNAKALYRRGMAHLGLNNLELARDDFAAVIVLDPNNKAAANQLSSCKSKMTDHHNKEKQRYANMFQKSGN